MTAERRVRGLFESARREDEASAPPFREVLGRVRPADRPLPVLLASRLAALAVVLLLIGFLAARQRSIEPDRDPSAASELPSSGRWQAPTDFLLATPGRDLLGSIPRIGAPMPFPNGSSESKKGLRT